MEQLPKILYDTTPIIWMKPGEGLDCSWGLSLETRLNFILPHGPHSYFIHCRLHSNTGTFYICMSTLFPVSKGLCIVKSRLGMRSQTCCDIYPLSPHSQEGGRPRDWGLMSAHSTRPVPVGESSPPLDTLPTTSYPTSKPVKYSGPEPRNFDCSG